MKRFLSAAAFTLLLSSCVAPIERRVTANPQMFNNLSATHKEAVRSGVVKEGMSKDAVYLAWGRPARVQTGRRDGKSLERWSYNSYQPVYTSTFGFGSAWGGFGRCDLANPFFFGGPTIDYLPVEGKSVEFVNDRVTGFAIPH
jgi:hypothetical protein